MSFKHAHRCKILLVDDSAELLRMLTRLLTFEGYPVRTASSREEALEILRAERFHVAVIDVRLDNRDPYNYEGLQLMYDLRSLDPSTGVILLTNRADLNIAREALYAVAGELDPAFEISRTPASAFLEKTPEALRWLPNVIRQILREVVQLNWDVQIVDLQQFMVLIPRRMRFDNSPDIPQLQIELEELLHKLFAEYDRIEIRTIEEQNQGNSKAFVFQVSAFPCDGGTCPLMIAKVGEYSSIEKEVRRFRNYIERWGNGGRNPSALLSVRRTRNLGGLIYQFDGLDGNVRDFAQFFHNTRDSALIADVIANLFMDTLSPEHRGKRSIHKNVDLRPIYLKHLRLNEPELQEKLDELVNIARSLGKSSLSQKFWFQTETPLIDPLEFMRRANFVASYVETTIHGDLHSHNVLIDWCNETWLIDFANTGKGALLQDYATFEASILIENNEQPPGRTLFEWSQALFYQPGELFPAIPERFANNPELVKVHQAILTVRHLAFHEQNGDQVVKAYLIGLFFASLRLTTVRFLTPPKRFHALMLASLIAENLLALESRSFGKIEF